LPRLLIGVLSSDLDGFLEIRRNGQTPTWISQARKSGIEVVPYTSSSLAINAIHRQILSGFQLQELVNRTPLMHVRKVRVGPGRLSHELRSFHVGLPKPELNSLGELVSNHPDSLASVGIRTLEFFKFALQNYDFDFLVRTNTSSFLNVRRLSETLSGTPRTGQVYALTGRWGAVPYPSGALYVLSRSDVEAVVEHDSDWIHEYIDDVALGLLLRKIRGQVNYSPIPRFEFSEQDIDDLSFQENLVHYRCKSVSPQTAVDRMLLLQKQET
jgi:hypothetical protein